MLIIGIFAFVSWWLLIGLCIDMIFDDLERWNELKIENEKWEKLLKDILEDK